MNMKTLYESLLDDYDELEKTAAETEVAEARSKVIEYLKKYYRFSRYFKVGDKVGSDGKFPVYWNQKAPITILDKSIEDLSNGLFTFVNVKATLDVYDCPNLKRISGMPYLWKGRFIIANCPKLESLEGCPTRVDGGFNIIGCGIKTLKGGPKYVDYEYVVKDNDLENLVGAPYDVVMLDCTDNPRLRSLKGCPKEIGTLYCDGQWTEEEVSKVCKIAMVL